MAKEALRFSFEGSRGVGRRWARTGAVMSNPLLSPAHPEYCQGDCTGKGQPALRRVAPRRSPASLDAVRSQPEVDTGMMTMTSRRWRWVSARGSADQPLAHCAESAAAHIRPVSKASRAGSQTACDQGRNVAEYLAVLPSRDARVIASARSGKLCVLDLLDQRLTVPACLHSCMHCGRLRVIHTWKLACTHAVLLGCTQSSVDEFRSQDFGLKLNWEAPMGSDLVYSILSPEWNADKTRVDKVRYWTAVTPVPGIDLCRSGLWREAGSGHEDSSHNILTLDALQVLSGPR
jgi:hypothetical protein